MNNYLPSIFEGLPKHEIDEAMQVFHTVDVSAEVAVIHEGEQDPTLAIVDSGELAIVKDGVTLGRATAGDMVGEMALFGSGERTATVVARVPSRLLVLDLDGFTALRQARHPVATAIEEHALHALTNRLRKVSDRIAALAHGDEESAATPTPGFFDVVATAFGSGGIVFPGLMNGTRVLKNSVLFRGFPDEVLADLAEYFHPVGARRGHFLCTEGEGGDDMFIIASGEVEVVVDTQNERVERLATITAGDAFGMCALLQPENPRMASCVAKTKVTGLSMGRLTFAELVPRNDAVGSALRVAMIRAMADQLVYANHQLAQLDGRRLRNERTEREVEALMRAAAALESHGEYLGGEGSSMPYLWE